MEKYRAQTPATEPTDIPAPHENIESPHCIGHAALRGEQWAQEKQGPMRLIARLVVLGIAAYFAVRYFL